MLLNVYLVGKALSKPCEMCVQQVKDYQSHGICVCTIAKTIKIMLNVHVVGKKLEK